MQAISSEQLNAMTPAQQRRALELMRELDRRRRAGAMMDVYCSLYGWQREFVASTATHHESCLCAANQIGKSRTGALIDAMHLTGDYPDDWPGHRFESPPLVWCLGYSMEKTRDLLQLKLFGELRDGKFSGGLIPAERIVDWLSAPGVTGACRSVWVRHKSGGQSQVQFWAYSQGQHAIMGDVVDFAHVDEEPKDPTIRPQLLTRLINGDQGRGGKAIYTFTPENGRTELVLQFKDTPSASQYYMQKGWADAPHMTPEKCERVLAQYPAYQRDMRSKGEPMLGHGRIYEVPEDQITIEPLVKIPDHWSVIHGMDFGWDHPQAHCRMYWDRDNDVIYLARSYKASRVSANDARAIVKTWGDAPTAWPQDGLQHEKGRDDAVQQKQHYATAGFRMLAEHAHWPALDGEDKNSRSVEQGILELDQRMRDGRFKVFAGQVDFFAEYRQYHRDENGKIVKTNDDILDAVRYAYMMRRFSVRVGDIGQNVVNFTPRPMPMMR